MSYLIVGLGNPGKKYTKTRHNIGFMVLDALVDTCNGVWKEMSKLQSIVAKISLSNTSVYCVKPLTFMNLSGEAVQKVKQYYKVLDANIMIILDDKDMEFGKLRWKRESGSGGHNGMKSVIEHLGSQHVCRLKIGVANNQLKSMDTADFVLSRFTADEEQKLGDVVTHAVGELQRVLALST